MDAIDTLRQLYSDLPAQAKQLINLMIWFVVLAAIFTPLERLCALHPKKFFRKALLTDIGYYFLTNLALSTLLSIPVAVLARTVHHCLPSAFFAVVAALPLWLRVIAAFIVGDIGFYWGHRWSHEIPFLWRFHAIHHSAEHVDYLVTTRAHPMDMVFTRFCGLVPLYLLGLAQPNADGGLLVIAIILVGTVWGFFIHSNVNWRFGPLEWLIATPAFHHWHHTNDGPEVLDKNYAATLPCIDKLFGTLHLPPKKQPETYGIDLPLSPILFRQLVDPFLFWRKPSSQPKPKATTKLSEISVPSDIIS